MKGTTPIEVQNMRDRQSGKGCGQATGSFLQVYKHTQLWVEHSWRCYYFFLINPHAFFPCQNSFLIFYFGTHAADNGFLLLSFCTAMRKVQFNIYLLCIHRSPLIKRKSAWCLVLHLICGRNHDVLFIATCKKNNGSRTPSIKWFYSHFIPLHFAVEVSMSTFSFIHL